MNDSSLSDFEGSANDKLPGFIQSSTENHGGSNPTPGTFGSISCIESVNREVVELRLNQF
jgi:hypothetical protein